MIKSFAKNLAETFPLISLSQEQMMILGIVWILTLTIAFSVHNKSLKTISGVASFCGFAFMGYEIFSYILTTVP